MLVLSRYRDESIYIGDNVVITVVDIRGDRVRIGVQAPPDVTVPRQEVDDAIKNGSPRESRSVTRKAAPVLPVSPVSIPSAPKPAVPPLSQELTKRKIKMSEEAKGLPVAVNPPAEFGGLTSDSVSIP
jgi:carbon storage regulator